MSVKNRLIDKLLRIQLLCYFKDANEKGLCIYSFKEYKNFHNGIVTLESLGRLPILLWEEIYIIEYTNNTITKRQIGKILNGKKFFLKNF